MKMVSVVGARLIFMKIAPFVHAIEAHNELRRRDGKQRRGQMGEAGNSGVQKRAFYNPLGRSWVHAVTHETLL